MSHHWLLITCSWFGTASLQYINTGGPGPDNMLEHLDSSLQYPLPFVNYLAQPPSDTFQNNPMDYFHDELQRKRRTADDYARIWGPNLIDTDKTLYLRNEIPLPYALDDNDTDVDKRNFSPWGGKRADDKASIEHMWTWKRAAAIREPSMPKRVRFSPWGGKRSGQMIYKPGSKGSKIIFSTSIPELTKIVSSNYYPNGERFDLAGFQFVPSMDKRHPMKVLALSTRMDEKTLRDALPFKRFLESLPRNFKPGHPYTDVHLKDGKRKVKFSAWGGKRSPPIIGPIWTPAPQDQQESTLNTILLIRNSPDKEDKSM